MSHTLRAMFPALCLALILPATAQDPVPAKDATATQAPVEREPLPARSQEDAMALERQVPKAEQRQIQAGSAAFLALWKPANRDTPKGVAILVPGEDETADWPIAVGPLRRRLPDAGWSSLSLTLPDPWDDGAIARAEEPSPTAATDKTDPDKKGDTPVPANPAPTAEAEAKAATERAAAQAEQEKAIAERIYARLDAAIAFAQQNKAPSIVLIGHGSGAYWAARYLSDHASPAAQRLVMVAASEPRDATPSLLEITTTLKVATADLVYKDQEVARRAAQQRLDASKRSRASRFTQLFLVAVPGNSADEQEQMFRRVRGWLDSQ